jgi:hypothetical protein
VGWSLVAKLGGGAGRSAERNNSGRRHSSWSSAGVRSWGD